MSVDPRLEPFVAFSAEATAFKTYELHGTGMAPEYLATVDRIVGRARVDTLLAVHAGITTTSPEERLRALRLLIFGDEHIGPIARNIVKLWYVGTWFALPAQWQDRFGPAPEDRTFVVSPAAYIEGLLWKAAGAHPPGAKAPGFGSWEGAPIIPSF
jgi:hypothetical protein